MAQVCRWRSFLCLFAQVHLDFRLQELLSLASLAKCEVRYDPKTYSDKHPFLVIELPSEKYARHIMSRSLLMKSMFELWGWGRDYKELETAIKKLPPDVMEPFTKPDYTFKIIATGFTKKCDLSRQKLLYERLSFLPLKGKVDVASPQHVFYILEDYGGNPNSTPPEPLRVFFGRLIAHGQRHLIQEYSIKTRHFIGNTSMDAELSFIMANQAKVKSGSFVYDPFAGTGSLLISCAHFGGYVLGSDIDAVLVHGRGRDENVLANLRQYGLEAHYVDMVVADAARCVWKPQEIFDAIVTDPPYGVREATRKVGSRKPTPIPVPPELEEGHVPAVCNYKLSDIFADLLDFAARFLVLGGRLVYWLPLLKHEFSEALIPSHPCLSLVASSEQHLQRHVARRLITMEKHAPWRENLYGGKKQAVSSSVHDAFRAKYFS